MSRRRPTVRRRLSQPRATVERRRHIAPWPRPLEIVFNFFAVHGRFDVLSPGLSVSAPQNPGGFYIRARGRLDRRSGNISESSDLAAA